ncbi:sterol 22-desaturase [Dorcoceras hygrometricum]|uniref:Sterol 22-desaturase n=1 Tax=Dorcoceras hygrometricum TaxID=472368 RepID=A0A2Z7AKD4_9LAMI|nr:sterol 22-desaturase [Dorcoceras hygrometricum]
MQHSINQCYECMRGIKESDSETRSVNPSQLGGRHSNPVVTTPMIALDFSGTTTQSASHNVALNQVVNQSVNQAEDISQKGTANTRPSNQISYVPTIHDRDVLEAEICFKASKNQLISSTILSLNILIPTARTNLKF